MIKTFFMTVTLFTLSALGGFALLKGPDWKHITSFKFYDLGSISPRKSIEELTRKDIERMQFSGMDIHKAAAILSRAKEVTAITPDWEKGYVFAQAIISRKHYRKLKISKQENYIYVVEDKQFYQVSEQDADEWKEIVRKHSASFTN